MEYGANMLLQPFANYNQSRNTPRLEIGIAISTPEEALKTLVSSP
jgi:hypothetical protein